MNTLMELVCAFARGEEYARHQLADYLEENGRAAEAGNLRASGGALERDPDPSYDHIYNIRNGLGRVDVWARSLAVRITATSRGLSVDIIDDALGDPLASAYVAYHMEDA